MKFCKVVDIKNMEKLYILDMDIKISNEVNYMSVRRKNERHYNNV